MRKIYLLTALCSLLLFGFSGVSTAQTKISGKVSEEGTNDPLAGVNILVKGKVIGTITDPDGNFVLNVNSAPPLTLVISYVGYKNQEVAITTATTSGLDIKMAENLIMAAELFVVGNRVPEEAMKSPTSIEKMDILAIKESAAPSFYDGIANMKGVDLSAQSLTFKSLNMRGFGANGNTRVVQLIDGIDNQAPGLNFPVGNIVGISELDLESVEVMPGAASALYGPNAINGIILMTSKSPFDYQGLSVVVKNGVNHVGGFDNEPDPSYYGDYSLRYAKAFNNKFAFKINASYLRANDFIGTDTRDQSFLVETGATDRGSEADFNRTYDGVNIYGDPTINIGAIADGLIAGGRSELIALRPLLPDGPAGDFTPEGFIENSFVDNTTESLKFGAALHYRINDDLEISGQYNYGNGSTVYTANDRFVLDNFVIWTGKLELEGDNFFLRAYTTNEDSGDSYAANTLASLINQETYITPYVSAFIGAKATLPVSNEEAHTIARNAARQNQENLNIRPGTPEWNAKTDSLRGLAISQGGALFLDRTSLWHYEGMYNLKDHIDFADVVFGANFRRYALESQGTLFTLDENGEEINIDEWGAYVQAGKSVMDNKLRLTGSIRYDKNENFDGQFSPRISTVYTLADKHNIRASFQQGFRIPTTQDQFIDLDVVTRRLVGSNPLLIDKYNFRSNPVYQNTNVAAAQAAGDASILQPYQFEDFQPEKVRTFEIGYKSLLGEKVFVDAYYYFSSYQNFITEITLVQGTPNGQVPNNESVNPEDIVNGTIATQGFGFDINADGNVEAQGWALGLEYSLPKGYRLGGNISFNQLIDQQDLIDQGFRASFNTPKYRTNLSFSNKEVIKNFGFNVTYRWQEAFLWESSFGDGIIPAFGTVDAQVSLKVPSMKSVVKLGGSNISNERYTTSFANPTLGAIYYLSITFDEFFN